MVRKIVLTHNLGDQLIGQFAETDGLGTDATLNEAIEYGFKLPDGHHYSIDPSYVTSDETRVTIGTENSMAKIKKRILERTSSESRDFLRFA